MVVEMPRLGSGHFFVLRRNYEKRMERDLDSQGNMVKRKVDLAGKSIPCGNY
tara:strand:- start:73 stop:228 length:156 start_codon:yes stop_codon:yes gene_type:complete